MIMSVVAAMNMVIVAITINSLFAKEVTVKVLAKPDTRNTHARAIDTVGRYCNSCTASSVVLIILTLSKMNANANWLNVPIIITFIFNMSLLCFVNQILLKALINDTELMIRKN